MPSTFVAIHVYRIDPLCLCYNFLCQVEWTRTKGRLTSELQQKDTEIQRQVAELQLTRTQLCEKDVQIHQREAELRQARTQLQQKDVELNSSLVVFTFLLLSIKVHVIKQ